MPWEKISTKDRFLGCLLGLAVGDAVGTTNEFKQPGTFQPITDMVGGGEFDLKPGQWTDDTSMALCLAQSLIECNSFDPADQMKKYVKWWQEGYLSSTGECFDIGNTVKSALRKFIKTGEPYAGSTKWNSSGNGCLMRLAPIPMFYFNKPDELDEAAKNSSRTTHGNKLCIDAAVLFARKLHRALKGGSKQELLVEPVGKDDHDFSPELQAIIDTSYLKLKESEIKGTGFVIESLQAAMWCFANSSSYRETVLKAANLGDDADTTASIAGQIAGAYYGTKAIPKVWKSKLAMSEFILKSGDRLYKTAIEGHSS